jgi:hypothetical protein
MMLPLVLVAAIVTQDATPLRAAAKETAAKQTLLYAGDWLELRGERQGWLAVYDHRHERPGYVRPSQVRSYAVDESSARDLAAIIDFVRDQPGLESLGIGYTALFLRAAPASAVGPELFDALGGMAERLGRRASSKWARPNDAMLAGEIDVAVSYGVKFHSFVVSGEREGRARVCYDGEAYRRVLALPAATGAARARAALGLTDPACVDPATGASDRDALTAWQADVLDKVDAAPLPAWLGGRVRIRAASLRAQAAYVQARAGRWKEAQAAEQAAESALALADKTELADDDVLAYDEAALRVAAVRHAASQSPPPKIVEIATRAKGETCVRFAKLEHCTYAVVWPSSVRVAPHGDAIVFAQSPLPSWTELVLLRRGHDEETIAPAAVDPELGYVELAGFSPDGARLLLAREARMTGPLGQPGTLAPWIQRSFQIILANGLTVEKQATRLDNFVSFRRWQSPDWRRATLALR